jgi:hypothetical protein
MWLTWSHRTHRRYRKRDRACAGCNNCRLHGRDWKRFLAYDTLGFAVLGRGDRAAARDWFRKADDHPPLFSANYLLMRENPPPGRRRPDLAGVARGEEVAGRVEAASAPLAWPTTRGFLCRRLARPRWMTPVAWPQSPRPPPTISRRVRRLMAFIYQNRQIGMQASCVSTLASCRRQAIRQEI